MEIMLPTGEEFFLKQTLNPGVSESVYSRLFLCGYADDTQVYYEIPKEAVPLIQRFEEWVVRSFRYHTKIDVAFLVRFDSWILEHGFVALLIFNDTIPKQTVLIKRILGNFERDTRGRLREAKLLNGRQRKFIRMTPTEDVMLIWRDGRIEYNVID